MKNFLTIDIEEWFHILDTASAPDISTWDHQESRFLMSLDRFLQLLDEKKIKATLFWLGWLAERNPRWVQRCRDAGHEISSHGYGHSLVYQSGQKAFREDIRRAKNLLEEITGEPVLGFRAPGFSSTQETPWFFDEVAAAGYRYDSSVFPAHRGHGGMAGERMDIHVVSTAHGPLVEFPQSVMEICGFRVSVFGGGYLRLAPWPLIRYGIRLLNKQGRPVIFYVHPREIDPGHPRLKLSPKRYFKCYVNLKSTMPKLERICSHCEFELMKNASQQLISHIQE